MLTRQQRLAMEEGTVTEMLQQLQTLNAHTVELTENQKLQKIQPPVFDGTDDVAEFIKSFELVATHNKWTTSEKFIRLKFSLTGSAKLGVTGSSYEEMKAQLLTQYQITTENALNLLKAMKWRPGANIYQFAATLKKLVKLAFPGMTAEECDKHCVREVLSILPATSQAAWLLKATPPVNFDDAVKRIHEVNGASTTVNSLEVETVTQATEKMMNVMAASVKQQSDTVTLLMTKMAEQQQEILKLLQTSSRRPSNRQADGSKKCFNCQKPGHFARNCPAKPQGNE